MLNLSGIFPPLPTSFDADENLALNKMQENIKTLSTYDLSGFLVLGSNGELVHLSEKEKNADGVDAVLVLNPFYFKGLMTTEALKSHYFAVADASEAPVIIYNMPVTRKWGVPALKYAMDKLTAYANRKPSYFGTPAVNLILALEKSLEIILKEGMINRIERHRRVSKSFRDGLSRLGLKIIPLHDHVMTTTLSAIYYPKGIRGSDLLPKIENEGVIVAGGLLSGINQKYFRVGHMGSTGQKEVDITLAAI